MNDHMQQAETRPAPMTLAEAQRAVDASILALGGYWPPLANLARLLEESGELARAVNQTHGPKQRKSDEASAELRDELGDVLYVTFVLANSLGVNAEDALRGALDKTAKRATATATPPAGQPTVSEGRETDL